MYDTVNTGIDSMNDTLKFVLEWSSQTGWSIKDDIDKAADDYSIELDKPLISTYVTACENAADTITKLITLMERHYCEDGDLSCHGQRQDPIPKACDAVLIAMDRIIIPSKLRPQAREMLTKDANCRLILWNELSQEVRSEFKSMNKPRTRIPSLDWFKRYRRILWSAEHMSVSFLPRQFLSKLMLARGTHEVGAPVKQPERLLMLRALKIGLTLEELTDILVKHDLDRKRTGTTKTRITRELKRLKERRKILGVPTLEALINYAIELKNRYLRESKGPVIMVPYSVPLVRRLAGNSIERLNHEPTCLQSQHTLVELWLAFLAEGREAHGLPPFPVGTKPW